MLGRLEGPVSADFIFEVDENPGSGSCLEAMVERKVGAIKGYYRYESNPLVSLQAIEPEVIASQKLEKQREKTKLYM
jgi:hypothetical protein